MLRDLLVHVDGSAAGRRRVHAAVALAARMGARLSGLHVTPPLEVPYRYKPSLVARAAANISAKLALDARASETIFSEEAKPQLADAPWFEAAGDVVQAICDQARYADLVILGQYEQQGPPERHPLPVAHSVVLRSGRPVLVVPTATHLIASARIAVAWDGSREAVRAIHDALPLLRLSHSIQIVKMIPVSATADAADANSLSAHLANHGVQVDAHVLEMRSGDEHGSLRRQIEQGHYDLVVMGGYSRPAWFELMFGGATHSIRLSSKVPVVVSH